MKKTMNMKKTFATLLVATAAASAASVADNQDLIESKVDSINAKRGLEVTGSIRAVAQSSSFDTDNDPTGVNKMQTVEKDEFVYADLNFGFRPYENVRANAMLRLGAGMQEYFASAAKTVSVPWINVEGNIGNSFYWVLGSFRQQYSPLTLFNPDVEIMYEAQIFERKRHMAEKQQLLEGNQRNLQGANVQFRHNLGGALGEIRAEGMFARINRNVVLDFVGAEGNIIPNDTIFGASQAANMDKWLAAGNFEWFPFNQNIYIGATPMYIFDNEDTYSYTWRRKYSKYANPYELQAINPLDENPQKTLVMSGRVGADIAGIAGSNSLILNATAEFALSSDDVYTVGGYKEVVDEESGESSFEIDFYNKETLDGVGLLLNANAGYKTDAFSVKMVLDGVYNDSNWYNNMAQSPKFFAQRIQNSDLDGSTVKYGVNSALYSSFDALYNFAPKFAPTPYLNAKPTGTNDDAFNDAQIESYTWAPYNKNSWGANVYTRNQLALLQTLADPALQLALPNGLATSNRLGGRANLIANIGEAAEVQGLFSIFQQVSPVEFAPGFSYKAATFMEFGGGAKVDVFKLLGFSKPLEISGSYKHSERTLETDNWTAAGAFDLKSELSSDFINAGLYVQFLPRVGFNAGFQMISTEFNDDQQKQLGFEGVLAPLMSGTQMQWMVGFDYNIAKTAWLAVNFGMMTVENEYNTGALVAAGSAEGAINLPNYYDVTKDQSGTYKSEFSRMILEASLNVEF
ncbi:MAG: hypothetical protein MJZ26_03175 [Fibrobacter sp.]|nr:hypothetical protein [Fibrobacter sp.]